MSERERAERLAKAIDDLLRGRDPELGDEELQELLQIARLRRQAALDAACLGDQYEAELWQRLEARIGRTLKKRGQSGDINNESEAAGEYGAPDPGEPNPEGLGDIIAARRQAAEEAAAMAEAYRDVVWQRLEARLKLQQVRHGQKLSRFHRLRLPFFKPAPAEADQLSEAIDSLILGEPIWEAKDSQLKDLVQLARLRQAMGKALMDTAAPYQGRTWARLQPVLTAHSPGARSRPPSGLRGPWPRLALLAACLAAIALALGPLPLTGLSQHPVARAVRFFGQLVAVTETDGGPEVSPPTETIEGRDVTTAEAQELLGLPVREPTYLPAGFQKTASKYFSRPITADRGGLFTLVYERTGYEGGVQTIIVWQEHASSGTLAVQSGYAQPLIVGSVEGTYYEGTWHKTGSEIIWGSQGSQTLIFDYEGIRIIIQYLDSARLALGELLAIAESMMAGPLSIDSDGEQAQSAASDGLDASVSQDGLQMEFSSDQDQVLSEGGIGGNDSPAEDSTSDDMVTASDIGQQVEEVIQPLDDVSIQSLLQVGPLSTEEPTGSELLAVDASQGLGGLGQ